MRLCGLFTRLSLLIVENTEIISWSEVLVVIVGAFVGILVLIALRVEYYGLMGYRPNMAPQIAYYFSPIFLLIVVTLALPIEAIFRKRQSVPFTKKQVFLIGLSYATMLSWWAFPGHWFIVILANPFVFRWLIGLAIRSTGTR